MYNVCTKSVNFGGTDFFAKMAIIVFNHPVYQ